jgi:hypothetical protein
VNQCMPDTCRARTAVPGMDISPAFSIRALPNGKRSSARDLNLSTCGHFNECVAVAYRPILRILRNLRGHGRLRRRRWGAVILDERARTRLLILHGEFGFDY